jgi:hypothetical protein
VVIVNLPIRFQQARVVGGPEEPESYTHFYPGLSHPVSKTTIKAITIQCAKVFPGTQTVEDGAPRSSCVRRRSGPRADRNDRLDRPSAPVVSGKE